MLIIGNAQTALSSPNPCDLTLPPALERDLRLRHIARSGQHLIHLFTDLLNFLQAEIGALELFKEAVPAKSFLEEETIGQSSSHVLTVLQNIPPILEGFYKAVLKGYHKRGNNIRRITFIGAASLCKFQASSLR
jgi:hypothetical protein